MIKLKKVGSVSSDLLGSVCRGQVHDEAVKTQINSRIAVVFFIVFSFCQIRWIL